MITAEKLKARKEELEKQRLQAIANANAIAGALQDCEFWLEQLAADEKKNESE